MADGDTAVVIAPTPDFAAREVPARRAAASAADSGGVRAVALFELAKGLLALLAAGGLELIGPLVLRGWLHAGGAALGLDARHEAIVSLSRALNPDSIHVAAGIAGVYAAMRLVEAWGLWRARAWASWLGCIGAAVYLPLDLYALARHPGVLAVAVLAINLWIVRVLARDLARRRRRGAAGAFEATPQQA
jgi:uncharacterized membrane protein (DUF2068 family)